MRYLQPSLHWVLFSADSRQNHASGHRPPTCHPEELSWTRSTLSPSEPPWRRSRRSHKEALATEQGATSSSQHYLSSKVIVPTALILTKWPSFLFHYWPRLVLLSQWSVREQHLQFFSEPIDICAFTTESWEVWDIIHGSFWKSILNRNINIISF